MKFRISALVIACLLSSASFGKNHKKRPDNTSAHPEHTIPNAPQPRQEPTKPDNHNTRSPESSDVPSDETIANYQADHDDDTAHGPLGGVCAELAHYYGYFAENFMSDAPQQATRNIIILFCNTLTLMADLADKDFRHIRIDRYANDLISMTSAFKKIALDEDTLSRLRVESPSLHAVLAPEGVIVPEEDASAELCINMHHMLRSPISAEPLLADLFAELKKYAKKQVRTILGVFHTDTQALLEKSTLRSSDETDDETKRGHSFSHTSHGRHMRQHAWLCRAAAHACDELDSALPQQTFLEHGHELMHMLSALLNAMSITYTRLASSKHRASDKSLLATQFAHVIDLLPQAENPLTRSSRIGNFLIPQCQKLNNFEEKEQFVYDAFDVTDDRNALLQELFPTLQKDLSHILEQMMDSLCTYTVQTLRERYWIVS